MIADKSDLDKVVEAILFVSGNGVELKDIAEKLEIDVKDVKQSVENLKEKHKDDGFNIITYKGCAQFSSNPLFVEDVATVLNPIREKQLTKAALETLGIIAYKQPVTKLDIEQVRGVNSDYAVQVLTSFKLIEVVGRKDAVGKPLLYGTTDEFLKRFDLQDINDLPDYEELLSRIKVLHETSDSLYKSDEIIPEEELPDSVAKREEAEKTHTDDATTKEDEAKTTVDTSSAQENGENEAINLDNKATSDDQIEKALADEPASEQDKKILVDEPTSENLPSDKDIVGGGEDDKEEPSEKDLKEILTSAYNEQDVWTMKDNDLL